jgi:hypothetical protein
MRDDILPRPPARTRGRPFEPGRSGNPSGRPPDALNKATSAAATLLAGEAERLTRRAVRTIATAKKENINVSLLPVLRAADDAEEDLDAAEDDDFAETGVVAEDDDSWPAFDAGHRDLLQPRREIPL